MKISENLHLIRKEFYVTKEVKRYVNFYLIVGKDCYFVDSGVAGSESLISEYLESLGKTLTDIKGMLVRDHSFSLNVLPEPRCIRNAPNISEAM